jgi:biopolymer transport protein TolQ
MSMMEIFAQTGIVVKLVLFILIVFSVMSWAIIFSKRKLFNTLKDRNEKFLSIFKNASNFKETMDQASSVDNSPFRVMFEEGFRELNLVQEKTSKNHPDNPEKSFKEHIERFGTTGLERALDNGMTKSQLQIEDRMSFLASIGSSTPFIGLFGTVWGIMDSFQGFASGGATIEKIAPGIAEALVATAIGLAVAIPAVLFFNHFSNKLSALLQEMENFKRDFINQVERDLI